MKKISIIIPVFNEEDIVDELFNGVKKTLAGMRYNFEFIVVDDGSTDTTLAKLLDIQKTTPNLKIIKLSRNWGHQNAYNAGLDNCSEDAAILMDGDLEDPPGTIKDLIREWENGYDVVSAVKDSRCDSMFKKFFISVFYMLMKHFSGVPIQAQSGMFSLIDKKVVKELKKCKEQNKYYVGLRSFVGFKQTVVSYRRERRYAGKPKQTYRKLINLALDAFFSFSFLPIRILTYFALLVISLVTLVSALLIINKVFNIHFLLFKDLPGWTSLVLINFFILGMQFLFMGILGEYIARIFDEVRGRQYYIIENIFENKTTEN